MSSLLEDTSTVQPVSPAQCLRTTMAAMRLGFTWFGTRKTLNAEQKAQAAESFGASGDYLSAGKKLVDVKHPAFRAVTAVKNRASSFWKGISLPFSPKLYQQECERVQSRFNEAVQLAEQAFLEELAKLVSHLTERLSGSEDGKPRVFRNSAVENLTEFFNRFRQLNIGSSEQLDQLVADAQQIIRGVEPQALRDNAGLRQHVATEMSRVQSVLDGLLVDRPRRNILRRPR